jgi:hypothetical protein
MNVILIKSLEIFKTNGGDMNFQYIIHSKFPIWNEVNEKS